MHQRPLEIVIGQGGAAAQALRQIAQEATRERVAGAGGIAHFFQWIGRRGEIATVGVEEQRAVRPLLHHQATRPQREYLAHGLPQASLTSILASLLLGDDNDIDALDDLGQRVAGDVNPQIHRVERTQLRATLANLAQASAQLQQTLVAVNHLATHADALVTTQGKATLESTRKSLAAVQQMSTQLALLVARNRGALAAGTQGMAEMGPTLRELQVTLRQLNTLSARLRGDPAGYLLGRQAPQEYRPR